MANYLDPNELEKRLEMARRGGATEQQIMAKRAEYSRIPKPQSLSEKLFNFGADVVEPITNIGRKGVAAVGMGGAGLYGLITGDERGALKFANTVANKVLTPEQRRIYNPDTGADLERVVESGKTGLGVASLVAPAAPTYLKAGLSKPVAYALGGGLPGAFRGAYESKSLEELPGKVIGGGILGYGSSAVMNKLIPTKLTPADKVNLAKKMGFTVDTGDVSDIAKMSDDDFRAFLTAGNKPIPDVLKVSSGKPNMLTKAGVGIQEHADIRQAGGKPSNSLGGAKLFKDMKSVGIRYGDKDQILESASKMREQTGAEIGDIIQQSGNKNVRKDILAVIDEALSKTKGRGDIGVKQNFAEVAERLKSNFADDTSLFNVHAVRQDIGPLTRAGKLASGAESSKAAAYNWMYGKLDDIIQNNTSGNDVLKALNKRYSVASKALEFANQLEMRGPAGIGAIDALAGATGFAISGGNPAVAIGSAGAAQAIRSPITERVIGKTLEGAGRLPQSVSSITGKLAEIPGVSNVAPRAIRDITSTYSTRTPEQNYVMGRNEQMPNNVLGAQITGQPQKPSGPISFFDAQKYGKNMDMLWVVSPDAKTIWNPNAKRWVAFDKSLMPKEQKKSDIDSKMETLLQMHGQLPSTGQLGGRYTGLQQLFGNPEAAGYEAASSSLAVEIAAAMGLKPLSEAEVAEVRKKWLPSPLDTPAQARAKINALKSLISLSGGNTEVAQ